jgi:hypothetical protein
LVVQRAETTKERREEHGEESLWYNEERGRPPLGR